MITMKSPNRMTQEIAKRAKQRRLELNLSQKTLSERSGVSYGSLRKFEQTGQIAFESLLKIALVLNALDEFDAIFSTQVEKFPSTLDELLQDNTRKRGRK